MISERTGELFAFSDDTQLQLQYAPFEMPKDKGQDDIYQSSFTKIIKIRKLQITYHLYPNDNIQYRQVERTVQNRISMAGCVEKPPIRVWYLSLRIQISCRLAQCLFNILGRTFIWDHIMPRMHFPTGQKYTTSITFKIDKIAARVQVAHEGILTSSKRSNQKSKISSIHPRSSKFRRICHHKIQTLL